MKNFLTRRQDNDLGFNFFDPFEDFFEPFIPTFRRYDMMKTDIKEKDNGYELAVDMPGYEKGDINVSLENGYLTVSAKREEKEEGNKNFLRKERSFSCSRSYYIGDVNESDIKARYNNGTLILDFPKDDKKEISSKNIEIE